ncbi:DUF4143 domain-containing protein [Vreelandella titanicae]|uniref:DUF4143 domain-containing protein n=1 Tax=Vreelandella titanicae TaxID=664683 RepID=UPI0021BD56C2|nr:DUF4143 domain-containing protein [Halomonas titanicae]
MVEQLMAQASWIEPELRFSHYRDKDQVEVDLIIERGQALWGAKLSALPPCRPRRPQGLLDSPIKRASSFEVAC